MTEQTKPRCKLVGCDGNIFVLAGRAGAALKKAGLDAQAAEMYAKVSAAQSYDEALRVLMAYVEVY